MSYDVLELTRTGAVSAVIRISAADDAAALTFARQRATAYGALVYRGAVRIDRVHGVLQ